MSERQRPAFKPEDDKVLAAVKVKNDREGYLIEVRSYQEHEPRVRATRYYKSKDGDWKTDKDAPLRFSFRLLRWLIANAGTLDKGYSEWENSRDKNKGSSAKPSEDVPF